MEKEKEPLPRGRLTATAAASKSSDGGKDRRPPRAVCDIHYINNEYYTTALVMELTAHAPRGSATTHTLLCTYFKFRN